MQKPSLENLTEIDWKDSDGETHRLKIIDSISSKWYDAALCLRFGDSREDYDQKYSSNRDRMIQVFKRWIEVDGTDDYAFSWEGLFELLVDIKHKTDAEDLKTALATKDIIIS